VGSVAQEAGSFCVPTQDVLLLQRTLGLATAQDFESALGQKGETAATTTTTTELYVRFNSSSPQLNSKSAFENWDFHGSADEADFRTPEFAVKECPSAGTGLLQTMDAAVSKKDSALTNGQLRVCACRSSLNAISERMWNFLDTPAGKESFKDLTLLQSLDGALSKKDLSAEQKEILAFKHVTCHGAKQGDFTSGNGTRDSWEVVARGLNNPAWKEFREEAKLDGVDTDPTHCDKYWVVRGACSEILKDNYLLSGMWGVDNSVDDDGENTIHSVHEAARWIYTQ